eukprot:Selendium_serpulae@DN3326_c0_g1_i1.p1
MAADKPKVSADKKSAAFVFAITYIGYTVLYSTRKPFSVVKTAMQRDLQLSTYALGTVDTAFLLSYALGQLFLPTFGDAFGVRNVLLMAYLGSGVCSFLFGGSSTATALAVCWLFNGLFHAAVFPLLVKSVALCFPTEQRGQALGIWTTSQQVGSMAATAFSAYIAALIDWRAAFIVPAALVALYGVGLYAFLPEPHSLSGLPTRNKMMAHNLQDVSTDDGEMDGEGESELFVRPSACGAR